MEQNSEQIISELVTYFDTKPSEKLKDFEPIDDVINQSNLNSHQATIDSVIEAVHEDPYIRFSVRGSKIRPKPPELNSDPLVILSKKMAAILRHGIHKCGLTVYRGSYVRVNDMLNMPAFEGYTKMQVSEVVNTNDKKRYDIITDDNGDELIGAVQGHSVQVENVELTPISSSIKKAYHATFYSNWEAILNVGLKKMGRNHIHLFSSNFRETIRDQAEIIIEIDVQEAVKDNIQFFTSKNNVILTSGNDKGLLSKKYFIKAWDYKSKNNLYHRKEMPKFI